MRVWAVMAKELGTETYIMWDRDEAGNDVELVFAESAYGQAVEKFNELRDERLSFHRVTVIDTFGADAHAHLLAHDGEDEVELRPITVIGA